MVDPIEVKLDEVEEHVLKTQADVDRLMRDFSKPDKNKDILAQLPAGGGGFFDQIVKAITGGGKGGGALGAGVAGGMAAGGIMALVDILKTAVSNSKILTTVLGTIGQALGLLIDVILLPFLPILLTGIIWLHQGIMTFYKFWNGIWSGKTFQNIGTVLTTISGILAKGIGGLLQLGINFLSGASETIWNFLQWVWQVSTGVAKAIISLDFKILGTIYNFLKWLWDASEGLIQTGITLTLSAAGAALSFLEWLWNTITSGGANLVINLTQGASNAVSNAASTVGSWWEGVMSGGWIPHFDQGGTVPGTGPQLAVVHGGETVTPAGKSAGGITINMPNYVGSKSDLMKAVTDALRQQQYRYQA